MFTWRVRLYFLWGSIAQTGFLEMWPRSLTFLIPDFLTAPLGGQMSF